MGLLDQILQQGRAGPTDNSVCGPLSLSPFVPDCPLGLVCFTAACEAHNNCYGTCGISKTACDQSFLESMLTICTVTFPPLGREGQQCHTLALLYWLAVATLGQSAYDATQEAVCPPVLGICCLPDRECVQHLELADCESQGGVFVFDETCTTFPCLSPPNDDCADAEEVCAPPQFDPDVGTCTGDPTEPCSLTDQDCSDGSACVPLFVEEFRCRVPTDNRLATTDGPPAGGACAASGENAFQADVWYTYVAACSGRLIVRMCDEPRYDAMLAVYGNDEPGTECPCPADDTLLLQCDDDFCGRGSVAAVVLDGIREGACLTIRVGGWSEAGTAVTARQDLSELDILLRCEPREASEPGPAPSEPPSASP